jgi:hypothetical protein
MEAFFIFEFDCEPAAEAAFSFIGSESKRPSKIPIEL